MPPKCLPYASETAYGMDVFVGMQQQGSDFLGHWSILSNEEISFSKAPKLYLRQDCRNVKIREDLPKLEERIAANLGPAKLHIGYPQTGKAKVPPVLRIQGLGLQLIGWTDGYCSALIGCWLRVMRFARCEVGRSSHISNAPSPDRAAVLRGDLSCLSYALSEMPATAIGLLDVRGPESVHLVGISMGGAIAQTVAIAYPERVRFKIMAVHGTNPFGDLRRPSTANDELPKRDFAETQIEWFW
jgi:hypothetical protein